MRVEMPGQAFGQRPDGDIDLPLRRTNFLPSHQFGSSAKNATAPMTRRGGCRNTKTPTYLDQDGRTQETDIYTAVERETGALLCNDETSSASDGSEDLKEPALGLCSCCEENASGGLIEDHFFLSTLASITLSEDFDFISC